MPHDPAVDQIANVVLAKIEHKLEQHLYLPIEMPSPEKAGELRERAPEVYELWLKLAESRAQTENFIQRAPYEVPSQLARSARPWALASLTVILAFCAYIASLGGTAKYIAGIVAVLNIAAIVGLFFGSGERNPTKKREQRRRTGDGD